jgi:hypothetical protein
MSMSADREQIGFAIKVLECMSDVIRHPSAREALAKIKATLLSITDATVVEYRVIWEDKIEENGRVVWRGEHELEECEYEVAMELRPVWQPTAQKFFRAVLLLYGNRHPERSEQ